jgi:hypothetical protein
LIVLFFNGCLFNLKTPNSCTIWGFLFLKKINKIKFYLLIKKYLLNLLIKIKKQPIKMNYAIEILKKEKQLLMSCLKNRNEKEYPEVFEIRNNRVKEIRKVIESASDLKKIAEIEREFSIFGTLTFEQQKIKKEILKKYEL